MLPLAQGEAEGVLSWGISFPGNRLGSLATAHYATWCHAC